MDVLVHIARISSTFRNFKLVAILYKYYPISHGKTFCFDKTPSVRAKTCTKRRSRFQSLKGKLRANRGVRVLKIRQLRSRPARESWKEARERLTA